MRRDSCQFTDFSGTSSSIKINSVDHTESTAGCWNCRPVAIWPLLLQKPLFSRNVNIRVDLGNAQRAVCDGNHALNLSTAVFDRPCSCSSLQARPMHVNDINRFL